MDAKDLRQKGAAELKEELLNLRREQFNLRMAQATGQSAKPDQFTKVRRNIARLKTVMAEQAQTGNQAGKQAAIQTAAVTGKVSKAKGASK